jgi:hypothetical protein
MVSPAMDGRLSLGESIRETGASMTLTFLGREPVLWTTAIRSVILAVMVFGVVEVSIEQLGAVMIAVEAVLALVTRQSVSAAGSTS